MAVALQSNGKPYSLHIYERDGHSLLLNRDDRNRQIVAWFMSAKINRRQSQEVHKKSKAPPRIQLSGRFNDGRLDRIVRTPQRARQGLAP